MGVANSPGSQLELDSALFLLWPICNLVHLNSLQTRPAFGHWLNAFHEKAIFFLDMENILLMVF